MLAGLMMLSRFWLALGIALVVAGISGDRLGLEGIAVFALVFLIPTILLHWAFFKSR